MSIFRHPLLHNPLRTIEFWRLIAALGILTAGFVIEGSAQSGRRSTGQSIATPTPVKPPEAPRVDAARRATADEPAEKVKLLFARQPTSKRFLNEDVIAASFFKRLTDFINVDCTSIGDLKQAQALARAKSERDAFVVLLKFDVNSYQSGTIILNSPDLEIEYFAFAPRTGKKHVKGKIYFQTIGSGRMQRSGWPNGIPIRITPEAAGIEAAETLHHLLLAKAAMKPRP